MTLGFGQIVFHIYHFNEIIISEKNVLLFYNFKIFKYLKKISISTHTYPG